MVNELAALIREALASERRTHGWTKEQQAQHYNIDPVTLWRWENGDTGKAATILIPLVRNMNLASVDQAA